MSHIGHKTVQCTCGNVIMTCRCPDPSKPVESVESCARCADKVIVEERHYEDGRIVRKVGLNGEWKAVDNPTGHTLYKQVQDLEMAITNTSDRAVEAEKKLHDLTEKITACGTHDDQRVNDYNHELLAIISKGRT